MLHHSSWEQEMRDGKGGERGNWPHGRMSLKLASSCLNSCQMYRTPASIFTCHGMQH